MRSEIELLLQEAKTIGDEISRLNKEIDEIRSMLNKINENLVNNVKKLSELREKYNELNEMKRKAEIKQILERKRRDIERKVSGRRRLRLDELRILLGEVEENDKVE